MIELKPAALGQHFFQLGAPPLHSGFGARKRSALNLGDLLLRQSFYFRKNDSLPIVFGQLLFHGLQAIRQLLHDLFAGIVFGMWQQNRTTKKSPDFSGLFVLSYSL